MQDLERKSARVSLLDSQMQGDRMIYGHTTFQNEKFGVRLIEIGPMARNDSSPDDIMYALQVIATVVKDGGDKVEIEVRRDGSLVVPIGFERFTNNADPEIFADEVIANFARAANADELPEIDQTPLMEAIEAAKTGEFSGLQDLATARRLGVISRSSDGILPVDSVVSIGENTLWIFYTGKHKRMPVQSAGKYLRLLS